MMFGVKPLTVRFPCSLWMTILHCRPILCLQCTNIISDVWLAAAQVRFTEDPRETDKGWGKRKRMNYI